MFRKFIIIIAFLLLTSCAGWYPQPGQTVRQDFLFLEYIHKHGNAPKVSCELPEGFKLKAISSGYHIEGVTLRWQKEFN